MLGRAHIVRGKLKSEYGAIHLLRCCAIQQSLELCVSRAAEVPVSSANAKTTKFSSPFSKSNASCCRRNEERKSKVKNKGETRQRAPTAMVWCTVAQSKWHTWASNHHTAVSVSTAATSISTLEPRHASTQIQCTVPADGMLCMLHTVRMAHMGVNANTVYLPMACCACCTVRNSTHGRRRKYSVPYLPMA